MWNKLLLWFGIRQPAKEQTIEELVDNVAAQEAELASDYEPDVDWFSQKPGDLGHD